MHDSSQYSHNKVLLFQCAVLCCVVQGEWSDRFQAALEGPSTGTLTDEQAAEALAELQVGVGGGGGEGRGGN